MPVGGDKWLPLKWVIEAFTQVIHSETKQVSGPYYVLTILYKKYPEDFRQDSELSLRWTLHYPMRPQERVVNDSKVIQLMLVSHMTKIKLLI